MRIVCVFVYMYLCCVSAHCVRVLCANCARVCVARVSCLCAFACVIMIEMIQRVSSVSVVYCMYSMVYVLLRSGNR